MNPIRFSLLSTLVAASAANAAFTSGDLAVVRINGAASKTTDVAGSVSIDVYSPGNGGGYTLTAAHALSSTGPNPFTLTRNTKLHDGILRQSTDGQYLTLGGYQAAVGAATYTAASATAPRVVARIDGNYTADTSTRMTADFDGVSIEAVASVDGSGFWAAGSGNFQNSSGDDAGVSPTGGLRYIPFGGASATKIAQQTGGGSNRAIADSMRNVLIASGQLYVTTASAADATNPSAYPNRGLYAVGTGLPIGGTNIVTGLITNQEGTITDFDTDGKGKPFPKSDCVLLDLNSAIPGVDTAYSTGGKADYQKWIKDSNGVWQNVFAKGFQVNSVDVGDINTLTAAVNGGAVTLFAATSTGVYQMADAFGYSTDKTPTLGTTPLFAAASGTQFRGIVSLVPEPASLAIIGLAGTALLRRKR